MMSTLLHETTSLCRTCKNAVPARVVARDGAAWMEKTCAQHGAQEVQLSDDAAWYARTRALGSAANPPEAMKEVHLGCPFDCGPCTQHEQKVRLPVVTITSACNLDCPICYVHNKNEGAFHMSSEEFGQILARITQAHGGDVELVNLTGGEPTLHPDFVGFLEQSRAAGVHRVSICTNGIRLAKDEGLVERLAALGARVALSFDSFQADADYAMQGAHLVDLKLRCLDLLEKHDVDTTLIPVMTRGMNDQEIGAILRHAMGRRNVRHVEVHTITYTGQSGVSFDRGGRISMNEVLADIERTTDGWLRRADFVPSPCAHPLCYQVAYVLIDPDGGPPIPFTRFVDRQTLYECLADHLYLEPTPRLERAMREAIDRLWAGDDTPESERTLRVLKRLIGEMFPTDRTITRDEALRISERGSKAIYVHSHMDEETFDTERLAQCCDSNCYADGTTVPVCAYNVLYREKEEHFMMKPVAWNERRGGSLQLPRSPRSLPIVGTP
jgi:7,8-dihydro-6-hydroxymethylpterin dimethyltransferase